MKEKEEGRRIKKKKWETVKRRRNERIQKLWKKGTGSGKRRKKGRNIENRKGKDAWKEE